MTSFHSETYKALLVSGALMAGSGCAVTAPPQIQYSNGAAQSIRTLDLLPSESEQTQHQVLYSAVSQSLQKRGIALSSEAETIAQLAIAESPSSLGLYVGQSGQENSEPRSVAEVREAKWLDRCTATRVQASLAVFDRATGDLVKRSKAESTICQGDAPPYEELGALLIDDMLGN